MIKTFSTQHLRNIFAEENKYEAARNLMLDLALGREIIHDGKVISKQEANDKVRQLSFQILEIQKEKPTKRDLHRAMERHGKEWFEVIEEVVDVVIEWGFRENDFFMNYVERRSIANDDKFEFLTEDETILSVAKVSGQHHDFLLQRLGRGQRFTVSTDVYGAAVGAQIDRYLVGQDDWSALVNAIAKAFQNEIMNQIYTQFVGAVSALPVSPTFTGNGTLVKATLDTIIDNVSIANGTDVVIMGTKTALKALNGITDVNWRSPSQKEAVANTGRLGTYEGTDLVEIPQRFAKKNMANRLFDDTLLIVMPKTDDKFIKMVDQGETEIHQITEKGEGTGRWDDVMKYEITRGFGIGVRLGRYFGVYDM